MRFSTNDSPNTVVFGDVKILWKFEGCHHSETILYMYFHSGMWKTYTFEQLSGQRI